MANDIKERLRIARGAFSIKDFPGDLFSFITRSDDYIDKHKLVIFKEDLDKLGGFISYEDKYAYIGINHKRPIYFQNLTLAHELGHWFLHYGKCFSDDGNIQSESKDKEESEAFKFGIQILYPDALLNTDNEYICRNALLSPNNAKQFGLYINDLCHKYILSFDVILRRLLYKNYQLKDLKLYISEINKALGFKYTNLDPNFYIATNSIYDKPSNRPYIYLDKLVNGAIENDVINRATGEAVLFPYRNRKGD